MDFNHTGLLASCLSSICEILVDIYSKRFFSNLRSTEVVSTRTASFGLFLVSIMGPYAKSRSWTFDIGVES